MYKRTSIIQTLLITMMTILALTSCTGLGPSAIKTTPTVAPTDTPVPIQPLEDAIPGIIQDRLTALENADYDLYMRSIGTNNPFFYNEQEHWFMDMSGDEISNVSFDILATEMLDESTGVITLRQEHIMDIRYVIEYPLLFKYEDGRWMDYGYHFDELKTDRFTIKYMPGEERLDEFKQMLDDAFDHLDVLYEERPVDGYELKLFYDQEMLRQRSIPANPWLFTGCAEADESLKMYTGHPPTYRGYPGVVQHELVHHITIRICQNNLPLWLLEGIAMYDGSAYYGFDTATLLQDMTQNKVSQTLADIEGRDLNDDLSRQEVFNYYSTSYMYVRYIVETYGRDALMDLFYEAGKKPYHDSTLNDDYETENHATAVEVIQTVLGLSKAELSQGYLAWVETIDFDNFEHSTEAANAA